MVAIPHPASECLKTVEPTVRSGHPSGNAVRLSWVENPRPESSPGTATFSTFLTFKQKFSTSGLGRTRKYTNR